MHIAVVHQHYTSPDDPGAARHYALIEAWRQQHQVTLIAAEAFLERQARRFPRVPEGVRLLTLPVRYHNAMEPGSRAVAFAHFAAGAVARGLRMPRPDVVLGVSSPLSSAAAGALVAAARRVPFVFDVKDLWPDFPAQMGGLPRLSLRPLYALERALYRRAAHTITLTPDATAHVAAQGVPMERLSTLYNGTDAAFVDASRHADLAALRRAHDLGDQPVLLYAGTFGRANHPDLLVKIAEVLHARGRGILVCVGDGFARAQLMAAAQRLPSLRVVGPVARPEAYAWFRLAACSVVSFLPLPVLGTTSPAKLFDSLACGTPVVVVNPGWMQRLVERTGCGFFSDARDLEACAHDAAALLDHPERLEAAGTIAAALYRTDYHGLFDRLAHARRYEAIFEAAVAERRARTTA